MAEIELTSDAFWRDRGVHVALVSGEEPPVRLVELLETVTPHLPEGGCLFRTSGSEGSPKWVALEKRAFLHSARVVNAHYDLTGDDRWLVALPVHHVAGFAICARAWSAGAELAFLEGRWEAQAARQMMADRQITAVSLVPTQVHDLLTEGLRAPESLRVVLVGGGRFEPTLMRRALQMGWPVCATYGMTETASTVACQALEHDRMNEPEKLEVLPHWQATVDDDGVLSVIGPSLARGYAVEVEGKWQWLAMDAERGLRTRDRVDLKQEGTRSFLRFLGRDAACVKIVGELVCLEQIERELRQLAGGSVGELIVIAEPDERREHRLVLLAETGDEEALKRLIEQFHTECRGFERISSWQSGVAFERTELGKLRRLR